MEPQAEWVSDKSAPNFCEYFEFGYREGASKSHKADDARKKLDALFKKNDGNNPEDSE